jgi:hypothetical protein
MLVILKQTYCVYIYSIYMSSDGQIYLDRIGFDIVWLGTAGQLRPLVNAVMNIWAHEVQGNSSVA